MHPCTREGSNSQCQRTLIYEQPCPFPYHKNMNWGQQDLRSALETTPAKRGHCLGWCGHCWCKIGLQNKHIPSSHYNKSIISSSILDNYERFGIYIEFSSDLDQADFCSSNRLDLGRKNVKALLIHIIKKNKQGRYLARVFEKALCTYEPTDVHIDRGADRRTGGPMDQQTNGPADQLMHQRTDGQSLLKRCVGTSKKWQWQSTF